MSWTRLDQTLLGAALIVMLALLGTRAAEWAALDRAADQMVSRVFQVSGAVHQYHEKTNRWFPQRDQAGQSSVVYPDPFTPSGGYQGLDAGLFASDQNAGLMIQLVQYSPGTHDLVTAHVFESALQQGEPYLRVLLDYGANAQSQLDILRRLQARLPEHAVAKIDEHYYAIDIRRLQ